MSPARLGRSMRYAVRGIGLAWRDQRNFRIEVAIASCALILCWWTGADAVPVLAMTGLVLGLELLNSSLESLVDLIQPEHHARAGAAKDLGAAAVLAAAAAALLVGLVVIGPPLAGRLGLTVGGA